MVGSRSGQRRSPGTCIWEKIQLAPFVPWRLIVLPGARDPQLAFKTERRGKLPVTQVLRCLTAIRCVAFATCFAHPSPVTSFPELFPTGRAGPEAPLRRSATQVFYRVMGMWCHPLFSWIEGRAGGCCVPREAGEVVLPWEPAVPRGGESSLGRARARTVAAGNITAVPGYC